MNCPDCRHENRPTARFCGECGARLQRACAACGAELPAGSKFCDECGQPASAAAPAAREPEGARKVVSILFADLVGSTGLHERLDPESARRFMESYYAAAREAVARHGGRVTQFLGDGVKAVFGIPRVAEDDAIRAVRAGVAMQDAFRALADQQRGAVGETGLRVAVNTGEVVAKGETEIIGDPVNVAARLQEQGRDGDVVIGEDTQRLVASQVSLERLGAVALKGRAEEVKAFRVVSLEAPADARTAAFVGREDELARIGAVYDRAVASRATRIAVLLGSPGLGKSRLIEEFTRRSSERATIVAARCDAAGGSTFAPIAAALRELLDLETGASADAVQSRVDATLPAGETDRARITAGIAGLLTGTQGAPEETFFVLRRFLAALATSRPIVLLIDDLQWAEPLLLDLVEHLVQWGRDLPLLVLIGARPELREVRSSLATAGGLVEDVLTLDGLDAGAAMRLAASVVGAADLPAAVAARVLATSEGNPLFIGELVRMLVDEGALTKEGDRWKAGAALATVEMPPTIHALLAARIERLAPEECAVLERAAVVGRQFSRSAVAALLPDAASDLDARLEALQRLELIERDTGWLLGEPVLRFHHVLIRDASYRRLLKGTRAELHERLAHWIEGEAADASEHDELIGRHLEEAHRLLGELGPLDDAGRALGERAATRLAAAGRRALAGDDVALAAGLLGRAHGRLDVDDPGRAELALDWCEALLAAGDVGLAAGAIDELERFAATSERLRAWHTCLVGQHTVLTAPESLSATVERVAEAAATLASLGDAAGEATGHFVHALALSRLGQVGACEASLDQALAAARRANDGRRANTVLAVAPLAALWGPSPVTRASGRCLDVVRVLRITHGAPAVEAVALSCQGVLEALRGRTDAAHRMIALGREMVEELGIAQRLFEADAFAGFVALLEGDVTAAERNLRGAYEGLRELGHGTDAARAAALLARALLAQDRVAEAEALSHESEALAGDDLKAAIAWRGVRAEALARRGEHRDAIALGQAAVEIASATDALLDHADARMALSVALRAAGRDAEADDEQRSADALWRTKGAALLAGPSREGDTGPGAPLGNLSRGAGLDADAPDLRPAPFDGPPSHSRASGFEDSPFANSASRARNQALESYLARDWKRFRRPLAEGFLYSDRRPMARLELDADRYVEFTRRFGDMRSVEICETLVATRGDRLSLHRLSFEGAEGDVGPSRADGLDLIELDTEGAFQSVTRFEEDDVEAAYAELDARWLAGEAESQPETSAWTTHFQQAFAARDFAALAGLSSPEQLAVNHRLVGWGTLRGDAAWVETLRALAELSPDVRLRLDHLRIDGRAFLWACAWQGEREGGVFETPFLLVGELDGAGRELRLDVWDADQIDRATARFAAAARGEAPDVDEDGASFFPNGAARAVERGAAALAARERAGIAQVDALEPAPFENAAARLRAPILADWRARDWDAVERRLHEDFQFSDRRRLVQLELDRDGWLAMTRQLGDMATASIVAEPLGSRGQRLDLFRIGIDVAAGDVGPSRIEHLNVFECNEAGDRLVAGVRFDADDLDAAYAELDARFEAGEQLVPSSSWLSISGFVRAVGRRDWQAVAALCADDLVETDHRALAVLGITRGADAWVQNFRELAELSPDVVYRVHHFVPAARGYYVHGSWIGSREGGPFELVVNAVLELDERGRIVRADMYDDDGARAALARLDELGPPSAGAPVGASYAMERWRDAYEVGLRTGDWEPMRRRCASDFEFEDRRRQVLLSGGYDLMLASAQARAATGARLDRQPLHDVCDRVAVQSVIWAGGPTDGRFEIEYLAVAESDASQLVSAFVLFDLDDTRAAQREAWRRWARIEPWVAGVLAPFGQAVDAFHEMDATSWCAAFAPNLVVEDHRRAGMGRIEGADAYTDSIVALWELAPVTRAEVGWRFPAIDRHGAIAILRREGTVPDGGDFESEYAYLFVAVDGLITRVEMFEMEALDTALARFEALRPAPAPSARS